MSQIGDDEPEQTELRIAREFWASAGEAKGFAFIANDLKGCLVNKKCENTSNPNGCLGKEKRECRECVRKECKPEKDVNKKKWAKCMQNQSRCSKTKKNCKNSNKCMYKCDDQKGDEKSNQCWWKKNSDGVWWSDYPDRQLALINDSCLHLQDELIRHSDEVFTVEEIDKAEKAEAKAEAEMNEIINKLEEIKKSGRSGEASMELLKRAKAKLERNTIMANRMKKYTENIRQLEQQIKNCKNY